MRAVAGLQGAWLLARGQPIGLAALAPAPGEERSDAAGSFWALALCLPPFAAMRAIDWIAGGVPADAWIDLLRGMLGLVLGWLGFLLLMERVCRRMGFAARWPRFVLVWNWCSLLQGLMALGASLPAAMGAPDLLVQTLSLAVGGWSLWLAWFATRLTLGVSGGMAAAMVLLDIAVELFASGVVSG